MELLWKTYESGVGFYHGRRMSLKLICGSKAEAIWSGSVGILNGYAFFSAVIYDQTSESILVIHLIHLIHWSDCDCVGILKKRRIHRSRDKIN
jgi:hypothetical protein